MPRPPRETAVPLLFAAFGLLLTPAPALASGFAIFEQGARGMGFAGAYTAVASDPSAIFHNAAGIAFLSGRQLYLGGTLIAPSTDFSGADPFPGSAVTEQGDAGVIIPPAVDYSHQISERLVAGVGIHIPYGLRTRWRNRDTTYTGRFISKRAELRSISINPTVAYKIADRLAVGAGVDVRISTVALERNVGLPNPFTFQVVDAAAVELESDRSFGLGFNVGVLAKPSRDLSVGAAYRHSVKADFSGSAGFRLLATGNAQLDAAVGTILPSGAIPVTTAIEFPSLWSFGAAYDWNEWTFAAGMDLHQWSSFDSLPLQFENRDDLSDVIEEAYQNTRIYRLGVERRLGERWTVRGGYFYDENPSPAESVSPLLPDADRHGLAAGVGFQSGRWTVDAANWYLLFRERSTEGVNRDGYDGTYRSRAELFAVSIGCRF